ncbi:hypothetical protein V6N12_018094 [Hibiscus sabdariffa]|uniref:Uncharacterized protein n=1 Tax=Hibiscus sabdariffa TaxID=183260 RepID=A0ABR2ALA1_9ROSI
MVHWVQKHYFIELLTPSRLQSSKLRSFSIEWEEKQAERAKASVLVFSSDFEVKLRLHRNTKWRLQRGELRLETIDRGA